MSPRDSTTPAAKRLRFDRFVLDLERGCLLLGQNEIPLRPKTFAVLRLLVENPGRLVSKDELFAAVWPDIAVTDDALVQSIGELRRALDGDGPRLIKTVPRRGYRFETDVSPVVTEIAETAAVCAAATDEEDTPEPTSVRAPATSLRHAPVRRLGLFALLFLIAAGLLWGGIAAEWRLLNVTADRDQFLAGGSPTATKPAIAVLPFLNADENKNRDYFADGLTQDVINALGRFSELTVVSWNAVLPYKSKSANPREIARRLAVRYQVEGSIHQNGDRVRVTAQLVDRDGRVLWSGRFDEALPDLFAVQDKITDQVTRALAIRVTQIEQRRVFAKPTDNLEAYDLVLRARPALQHPARAEIVASRALLKRAIQLDPNYAAAYAALAETYYTAVSMGWAESPAEFLGRAAELANKALGIDATEVGAYIILGRIDIFHHRYERALAEMDHAIAINPNNAKALAGRGNVLMWLGKTAAAIDALEQAQRIDPQLSPIDRFALSLAYYLAGRYDAAVDEAQRNLRETAGANFSRIVLAAAYARDNQTAAAARVASEIHRLDPTFDAQEFGTKFLNSGDLENLRVGLREAGLFPAEALPSKRQ